MTPPNPDAGVTELAKVEAQLAEALETLRAIRHGEVDALVVSDGSPGEQVFTLSSADRPYRMFVETMRDGAATVSDKGAVLYANRRLAELLERPLSQIIGFPLSSLVAVDSHERLARIVLPGPAQTIELDLLDPSGGSIPVRVGAATATVEAQQLVYLTVADLTRAKRVEERLAAAHEKALEVSRLKSQFVANMSHEIRTPLNGVLGMGRLLAGTTLDDEQREYADGIETSGVALMAVIDDILDFSEIEAGRLEVDRSPFALRALLEDAFTSGADAADAKGVKMVACIDEGLPEVVLGDVDRVRRVLDSLLTNAIKFTPAGKVRLRVVRNPDSGESSIRFEVSDTGIGIAEKSVGSIFDSFSQEDGSTTRAYGGTGLGLAISRKLVGLMGGEIGVDSIEGEGSTFWVTLPLSAVADDTPLEPIPGEQAGRPTRGACDRGPVLLAEDNKVNQLVAVRMLERQGFRVDVAENGRLALDLWERDHHRAVFMDCQMPVLDGYEATAELRRRERESDPRTVIIAMTANTAAGDRERCLAAGMDDYIAKPVSERAAGAAVARSIGGTVDHDGSGPAEDASAPTTPPALLDRSLLDEVCDGDASMYEELVALFEQQSRAILDDISRAIGAGDAEALGREAHTLKGSSASVGARRMAVLSEQLSEAARAGVLVEAPDLLAQLDAALTLTSDALRGHPAAAPVSP